jgi:hypothetical protein
VDINQAVKLIEKKIDTADQKTQEAVLTVQKAFEDGKKEFEAKVVEMNTNLAAKDATIAQIQGEVIELKAKAGRPLPTQSGRAISLWRQIHDLIGENREKFEKVEKAGLIDPIEVKTVANMTSSNLSGDNYQSYLDWRPGMEPTGQFRFRDLVRVINSATDFVQFPRANTPIGEGSFARVSEGATKPQVDRDYTMVSLTLKPMAGYAIVSRQALRNIIFLQSWLPTSMLEQLQDAEDADFANTLVAAATGSSTTTGVTVAAERVIYLIRNLISAKYNPNAIVVDPAVWAALLVYRPGTDNPYSLPSVVTVQTNGTINLLGRPIYPVNWLTGGRIIVGDWSKAAIVQSEGLTMRQTDSHASTFITNETTFLLERTEALAVFRPDAFITTTLA